MHRTKRGGLILLIVMGLLVLLRLALPSIVRNQLNARLDRMGEYHGHVDDVTIHLWRGAYSIHGLSIEKLGGKVPVHLLDVTRLDISISWAALVHGGIKAKAEFDAPVLNFVDSGDSSQSQSGKGNDWRAQLESIIPIQLDEVVIRQGTVAFHNFGSNPPVDLKLKNLNGIARNLTNVRAKNGQRVADVEAHGDLFDQAPVEVKAHFDPFDTSRQFDFEMEVRDIELTRANSLIRPYAKLDLAAGTGSFTLELHAKDGHVTGYAKPLLHDMKVFSWKQDVEQEKKNPLQLGYELLAEGVTKLFTNQNQDQFGTRVPIEGTIGESKVAFIPAILNILRNAFIEAYKPGFEKLQKDAPDAPPQKEKDKPS